LKNNGDLVIFVTGKLSQVFAQMPAPQYVDNKGRIIEASRSLNVLMKIEKAFNHNGFWPFHFRRNL
jgi:hypothetical protein